VSDFQRPKDSFRFDFGGVNTKDVPDALAPNKYAAAQNIRSTGAHSIRTRPGYVPLFTTGNAAITDIRAYSALNTDTLPRFLARNANGGVWLDTGSSVGNMAGNAGFGCSMLPFRPAESPQTWMYIGAEGDYLKFSAPTANNVTVYKVGIAEPQVQVEAGVQSPFYQDITGGNAAWVAGGNAGAVTTGVRSSDATGAVIADPVVSTRFSVQVGNNAQYSKFETVTSGAASPLVQDVLPAIGATTVTAVYAGSGFTTIVPAQIPIGNSNSRVNPLAGLRRGSLVSVGGNVSFVLGVEYGPNGLISFDISGSAAANANLVGVPALILDSGANVSGNITSAFLSSNFTTGIGRLSQNFGSAPWGVTLGGRLPQEDDYIHLSVSMNDPTLLIQALVMFNLDAYNNNAFNGNVLYYSIRPGDLVSIPSGEASMLPVILQAAENEIIGNLDTPDNLTPPGQSASGNNQWAEITFPVSALNRLGNDQSKTLASCTSVQIQVNVANNCTFRFGSLWKSAGTPPDVGNNGAPYQYQCVPLSSLTGVRGNPTPIMRYGVNPRRQSVLVKTSALNSSYDPQIDMWEVYRYGGSVTSYRFLGTTPVGSDFVDNYFDDAALAGPPLPIDNTEPWPSIDVPWSGNGTVAGPYITASGSFPASITRWLPGTIILAGNNEGYTLRARPVASGNGYVFECEECVGSGNTNIFVLEPNVARQTLPYLWGPNEQGYFFGCGDPLRPGVVSWSKGYAPDAVPTGFNLDLCPPSEPLLGGEVIRGISLVASSKRWWALYFQQGGNPAFSQIEVAVGKRLASPWGKATDGTFLYFWATDGISATAGGAAQSLTDKDLYNLFPHGGISGKNVTRAGITYYAPDYSRAATFRMAVREGILYATYQDSTGAPRMLIGEIHVAGEDVAIAWSSDAYAASFTVPYAIEQPKGTLSASPSLYPAVVMGANNGAVVKLQDGVGDGGNNITALVAPFEWDGGDLRSNGLWGDLYLDALAPAGLTITPVSQGVAVANNTSVAANNNRQFVPVSLGGGVLTNFMGMQLAWTDANNQAVPTTLYAWQPSFVDKPETITNRYGDWWDFGGAHYIRGVVIHADTNNNNKLISIRNADTNGLVTFSGGPANGTINHNGEQEKAYYFPTPFVSHMLRDEAQDSVEWRKFRFDWIKDPWPELSALASPWMDLSKQGAKYLRGAVIPMDTDGAAVSLTFLSSDGGNNTVGPFTTTAAEKTAVGWAFTTPLIGHDFQLIPSGAIRVWYDEIRWDYDLWPELIAEASGWMNLGQQGAKYLRGAVIPMDTNGAAVSLTFLSSDGGSATVGPFTTTAQEKTAVAWAFDIPLIGHDFQLVPSDDVRVWYDEIRWDFDAWPELINEATGWMPVLPGGGAAFLQGVVLPIETAGTLPALSLLTDTGLTIALVATVTPGASIKTGVPYSLATPTVCHQVQLLPTSPCRIWLGEIVWVAEPTPELATTWTTQWTALGSKGYKHIARIEAAYASTADLTLTITSQDGTSPVPLVLPSTGGVYEKRLLTLTLNKGQAFKFSGVSPATCQIFWNDFIVWRADWGRVEEATAYRLLGAEFGDRARI